MRTRFGDKTERCRTGVVQPIGFEPVPEAGEQGLSSASLRAIAPYSSKRSVRNNRVYIVDEIKRQPNNAGAKADSLETSRSGAVRTP